MLNLFIFIVVVTHLQTDKTNKSSVGKFISRYFQHKHRRLVPARLPHYGQAQLLGCLGKRDAESSSNLLEITK